MPIAQYGRAAAPFNVVPVDFIVNGLLAGSKDDEAIGETFHLVDPEPITGHDIQYAPGMHLARVVVDDGSRPRLVQVETEFEFSRADRGRPELTAFDAKSWGDERLRPTNPVSASFTVCDVSITPVRYLCNPDLPAAEETEQVPH